MLTLRFQLPSFILMGTYTAVIIGIGLMLGYLIIWRALVMLGIYRNRPVGVPIKNTPLSFGNCLVNLDFIRSAPAIILRSYKEFGRQTFAIRSISEYQVLACSEADARAVREASEQILSFHAAMTDRLKHKYTMFGFEHNEVDPHNVVPARTLKVLLRTHLPDIRPSIIGRVQQGFEIAQSDCVEDVQGWTSVSAFSLAKCITEAVNTQVYLGTELADSRNFVEAARRYSHDAIVAAETCRQLPGILTPLIAPAIMSWSGAMRKVHASISEVVQKRLRHQNDKCEQPMDCLQWIIQSSHTEAQKSPKRLTQQAGALFFASLHQMPMAFIYTIYSLCMHPEYIELLRQEAMENYDQSSRQPYKRLVLLEAVLRESARLNPLDALSIQRKVLEPLQLPSGVKVPAGNLIAVPQEAVLRSEHLYPEPESFNPFRYLSGNIRQQEDEATARYTDVNADYPYWGSSRKPCPGRWYVSETMKIAVLHLITSYDFKLADENAPRSFFWTTALVPRMSSKIMLRKRTS